jgi:NADH-quinone oxidoreductase subunit L
MTLFLQHAWLIPSLPLVSFLLISCTPLRRKHIQAAWLAIALIAISALWAIGLLVAVASQVVQRPSEPSGFAFAEPALIQRFDWLPTGSSTMQMGFYIDPIVAVMLAMVTITSSAIHLFSLGYMAGHPRQARFFSFISLFSAAMLLMTLADNLLLFFMAWEIMGLCSYLLIGFLYTRPQAAQAALKAFITTRIGDVLMLLGMVYLYTLAGSLAFGYRQGEIFAPDFLQQIGTETNRLGLSHATTIALLLFGGTIGKSAQFPLHVWLPDAMEGPTPVSALIHAATMVAAGVFLVGRTYPIFLADGGTALAWVTFIGALTAIVGASIAVAQFDIKRILAYSTISQLGFMVAALGIGGWMAAMFHLLTHAFFKALLFLGSGSIIHAMEAVPAIHRIHHHDEYAAQQSAQDIRNMGGLRSRMPWTFWCYTMGYLALIGIVPFSGFWSKDEILTDAFVHQHWLSYAILSAAALLTAFYMTRQWRATFFGAFRGDNPRVVTASESELHMHEHEGAHAESDPAPQRWPEDWRMIAPLVLLASFAVTAGAFNLPFAGGHWLSDLLGQEHASFNLLVAAIALILAGIGVWLGWSYATAFSDAHSSDPLEVRAPSLFQSLNQRLYVDQFYRASIIRLAHSLATLWRWIDTRIFDRTLDGLGDLTLRFAHVNASIDDRVLNDGSDALANGTVASGDLIRRSETGKIHDYLAMIFAGVVILGVIYLYLF